MWTKQKPKNNYVRYSFYTIALLISLYYTYHSYVGAFGLQAYGVQEQYIADLNYKLANLVKERDKMLKKVEKAKTLRKERLMNLTPAERKAWFKKNRGDS